jgi:hypothetical protein
MADQLVQLSSFTFNLNTEMHHVQECRISLLVSHKRWARLVEPNCKYLNIQMALCANMQTLHALPNIHGRWSDMGSKKDCLSLISTNPISICSSHVNTKIVLDIGKLVSNMLYSYSS